MVRAFAIAPTASCSYRSKDVDGFTSTPEIAPPISRTVDRDSGTFGVQTYNYGEVEVASEVGWWITPGLPMEYDPTSTNRPIARLLLQLMERRCYL